MGDRYARSVRGLFKTFLNTRRKYVVRKLRKVGAPAIEDSPIRITPLLYSSTPLLLLR
jgi:hypothetical protein